MRESELKSYLVRRCKELDVYHRKFTSPGSSGVLDWILANNEKIVMLELKATGKKPTAAQNREIARLTAAGIYATYAQSYAEVEFVLSYLVE